MPKNLLNQLLKDKNSEDVFEYLTDVFVEINRKGKRPILIIDELQKIGDLKLNGFLIYELFNYFISLTKHKHLCHVFCLSSDSLFIDRTFARYICSNENMMPKASKVPFNIYSCESIEEKELIYSYVDGKPVDIIYIIEEIKNKNIKKVLDDYLKNEVEKLKDFLRNLDYIKPKVNIEGEIIEIRKEDIINALKLFKNNYEISVDDIPKAVYLYLVKENKLFLNPQKGTLKPQSYLVWNAIQRVI
ncbi:ATP-binding protein [Methanocaldococcus sp. 10A]